MDPLTQLNDISLGDTIGLWPLAWGWWCIIAIMLTGCILAIIAWRKHKVFNAARRQARQEIQTLVASEIDLKHMNTAINQILKRFAKHYFEETAINKLHGQEWIAWLSQQLASKHQKVFETDMVRFTDSLYSGKSKTDELNAQFIRAALLWVSKAKVKSAPITSVQNLDRGAHV